MVHPGDSMSPNSSTPENNPTLKIPSQTSCRRGIGERSPFGNRPPIPLLFTHYRTFDSPNIGGVQPHKSQNRQLSLGPPKETIWVQYSSVVANPSIIEFMKAVPGIAITRYFAHSIAPLIILTHLYHFNCQAWVIIHFAKLS